MIILQKWMKCNGFSRQQLIPAIFQETGRGLMANKSFKPGDTIISIPACLLITTGTVLRSSIGHIIKQHRELTPRQILCIFLIIERHKGHASFWNAYISQLPDAYTTPSYFTDDELNILPDHLRRNAIFQIETVNGEFQKVQLFSQYFKSLDPVYLGLFTFEAFRWAWFVINTRSVYMDPGVSQWKHLREVDSYALAPFLDLLNHSAEAVVIAGFNQTSNCYEIQTSNSYDKFDQVFICYGPHGNEKLLLEYGFVVPANHHTILHIPLELIVENLKKHMSTSKLDMKLKFMKEDSQLSRLSELTCGYDGMSWLLVVALRVLITHNNNRIYWKRIALGQEPVPPKELMDIKGIAECLLKSIRIQITKKIGCLAAGGHYELLGSFMQEQLQIVDTSIELLDQLTVS